MHTPTIVMTCLLVTLFGLTGALAGEPLADYTEMPEVWTCGGGGPEPATCTPSDRAEVGQHTVVLNGFGGEHFLAFPKFRNAVGPLEVRRDRGPHQDATGHGLARRQSGALPA